MGSGTSWELTVNKQIDTLLSPDFKDSPDKLLDEILLSVHSLEEISTFQFPPLKPESFPSFRRLIGCLVRFLHQRAAQTNDQYSALKEGSEPAPCHEGVASRVFLLHKLLRTALRQAIPLADFLWTPGDAGMSRS